MDEVKKELQKQGALLELILEILADQSVSGATETKPLTLLEFAEVFLTLPEASKREVLGYAKCLYSTRAARERVGA